MKKLDWQQTRQLRHGSSLSKLRMWLPFDTAVKCLLRCRREHKWKQKKIIANCARYVTCTAFDGITSIYLSVDCCNQAMYAEEREAERKERESRDSQKGLTYVLSLVLDQLVAK